MEQLFHGLIIGSVISFIALGYALIYSILKFINFAHGEVMMAGAYFCYGFLSIMGVENFHFAVLFSIIATGILGVFIERVCYKPLRSRGRLTMLLSSLGISIILQAIITLIFTSSALVYTIREKSLHIGEYSLYFSEIIIIVILVISFIIISLSLTRSRLGLAVRAISSNPTRLALLGIPVDQIISIFFFLSSALAAIAGIGLAVENGLIPSMGFQYSIWAFAVVVIAGLGSLRGIIIGGVLFGIVINYAIVYSSSLFANGFAITIMALILLLRPQGLFPQRLREF